MNDGIRACGHHCLQGVEIKDVTLDDYASRSIAVVPTSARTTPSRCSELLNEIETKKAISTRDENGFHNAPSLVATPMEHE
jgi:hypothetical protein